MNKRKAVCLPFSFLQPWLFFISLICGNGQIFQMMCLLTSRWIVVASLVLFAIYKRSLTTWILVAMAIGVEIGIDFPKGSQDLKFLSTIFLRLVKTIVAPLLFRNTGCWYCQSFQPETGGKDGMEISIVF